MLMTLLATMLLCGALAAEDEAEAADRCEKAYDACLEQCDKADDGSEKCYETCEQKYDLCLNPVSK